MFLKKFFSLISNWRDQNANSALFQFDNGDNSAKKLISMKNNGLLFVEIPSLVDNYEVPVECIADYKFNSYYNFHREYKNIGMRLAHTILEIICYCFPIIKKFILTYLFPYYALYFVV